MAPIALESEDHSRDAAFNKVLHGESADSKGGFRSMLNKDRDAHKAASEEYFKHWDNKSADSETAEIREVKISNSARHFGADLTYRLGKLNTQLSPGITITWQRTSMNMAGVVHSISAASPTPRASTKPLLDMSTT